MALDPSIILRDISPKFEPYENVLAKQMQIKAAQQQYDDNAFKMQQDREAVQQQNALAQFMSTNPNLNDPATQAKLYGVGGVAGAQKYLKGAADVGKVQADTQKAKNDADKIAIENHLQKFEVMERLMRSVRDQSTFDQMKQQAAAIPMLADLVPNMPAQYDPQMIADNMGKAMALKDRLAAKHQELTLAETGRHNLASEGIQIRGQDRQSADNAASRSVTMRGQNMTDARSRESNAANMSKPFEVTDESGNKVLVQQDKQGNIKRVEGFSPKSGADKPLTDAQSKAALFGTRMQNSDQIINELASKGTTTSVPFSRTGFGVGGVINAASSGSQQQLDQAKRDFINATLRRESGAVISPSEFDNAEKQYFPQIGDSAAVIKQKANNRAIATRGVQAEVPKGQRGVINEIAGSKAPSIDSLLQKYAK